MICFVWDGFPQYAARCIRTFVKYVDEAVVVLATKPDVPIRGMDELCGCRVMWIERNEPRSLVELLDEVPRCIFLGGWNIPAFNRFRDATRSVGGRAIGMCDNNFMFSMKECLKAIRFRLRLRGKYDGFFVPGNSGVRLLQFYGVSREKITTGMYSADATLFKNGLPLAQREKKIIYVGQFIERKNVRRLVQTFISANVVGDWTLDMYGSGPLRVELDRLARRSNGCVRIHDFCQPEVLADKYREARVFCLPSLWEHWGLVVHEAALSGCVLLLGNRIGAADDLLGSGNGFTFNPYDTADMTSAIQRAMCLEKGQLQEAQEISLSKAAEISLDGFAKAVAAMAGKISE